VGCRQLLHWNYSSSSVAQNQVMEAMMKPWVGGITGWRILAILRTLKTMVGPWGLEPQTSTVSNA
jgi:hypothetical protein